MEVLQAYSSRGRHYESRFDTILKTAVKPTASRKSREHAAKSSAKVVHRLTATDQADITVRYQQGWSSRRLAETYGLSKTSVVALLREKGIPIRYQGLDDSQIQEIIQHYAAGASLAATGKAYSVSAETIRNLLKKQGVAPRNPWDHPRLDSPLLASFRGNSFAFATTKVMQYDDSTHKSRAHDPHEQ